MGCKWAKFDSRFIEGVENFFRALWQHKNFFSTKFYSRIKRYFQRNVLAAKKTLKKKKKTEDSDISKFSAVSQRTSKKINFFHVCALLYILTLIRCFATQSVFDWHDGGWGREKPSPQSARKTFCSRMQVLETKI
jgi:hypothetical protein